LPVGSRKNIRADAAAGPQVRARDAAAHDPRLKALEAYIIAIAAASPSTTGSTDHAFAGWLRAVGRSTSELSKECAAQRVQADCTYV
jgi:hypothetical protein